MKPSVTQIDDHGETAHHISGKSLKEKKNRAQSSSKKSLSTQDPYLYAGSRVNSVYPLMSCSLM